MTWPPPGLDGWNIAVMRKHYEKKSSEQRLNESLLHRTSWRIYTTTNDLRSKGRMLGWHQNGLVLCCLK